MEQISSAPQPQNKVGADAKAAMQYQANSKSAVVAYVLWWLLGVWGGHRFYSGRKGSAIAMLLTFICSVVLCLALVGFVGIAAVVIWWIVDAFLIPGWIRDFNNRLVTDIAGS